MNDPAPRHRTSEPHHSLEWRCIGPHRGGRVVAVAGHPTRPMTFYMGSTGGGVWETTNGGVTWRNISDGFFGSASVGAIAVAPSDPNVIYVGMGECSIRGNVSFGDGVYRSRDGGRTWTNVGLRDTRHIARVRVHPEDPDLVYVAALGHAFGPNDERGVFRSRDGGATWERVLHVGPDAGAIDLSMDPTNPRILFAAFWRARRGPWFLSSGGEGSGLHVSTDGGDTWTDISRNRGLPRGTLGKIGVAVSPARPERVWAMVEAEEGGLFRSDDRGATWTRVNDSRDLRSRAWYYMHMYADTTDPDTCYVLNNFFWKSTDGGRTFTAVPSPHPDHHDLWIDPRDHLRMIHGNDGGACVSFDGGESWSTLYNQPTGEFYHVTTDSRFRYRVYGAQQDNTTLSVPSSTDTLSIDERTWYDVGGAESGHIAVRQDNPDIIFAGSSGGGEGGLITRYDRASEERRIVSVWPEKTAGLTAAEYRYRFQWTSPIVLSPHDPNVLYSCGNHVFRSTDEGNSWERISPDLTRNDPETLGPSGGPITKDHTGVEVYGTVFAFAESPVRRGVLWAGSDDGRIHLSKDDGATWQDVTPSALPEWSLVSIIEPSPHDPAVAYVAATRYKLDDTSPYLLKTSDYGATWTTIVDGIRPGDYTRVIREDPERRGLLYAGTETGVYVSFDDGGRWEPLNLNLPTVPIHDLVVKNGDLVAATHGRAFWILDDVTPLRQRSEVAADARAHLFRPRDAYRAPGRGFPLIAAGQPTDRPFPAVELPTGTTHVMTGRPEGGRSPVFLDAGQNPPRGVVFHFWIAEGGAAEAPATGERVAAKEQQAAAGEQTVAGDPAAVGDRAAAEERAATGGDRAATKADSIRAVLTILDADGTEVRRFATDAEAKADRLEVRPGANRFVWNMRWPAAEQLPDPPFQRGYEAAPLACPGEYRARLEVSWGAEGPDGAGAENPSTASDGRAAPAAGGAGAPAAGAGSTVVCEQPLRILPDPRVESSPEDFRAQFEAAMTVRDTLSAIHRTVKRLREVRGDVERWVGRLGEHPELRAAGEALVRKLLEIEGELVQVKWQSPQDTLNFPPKLNAKVAYLAGVVGAGDHAPTRQAMQLLGELRAQADEHVRSFEALLAGEVRDFGEAVRQSGVPLVG